MTIGTILISSKGNRLRIFSIARITPSPIMKRSFFLNHSLILFIIQSNYYSVNKKPNDSWGL